MEIDRDAARSALISASAAFGVVGWLAPNTLGRVYGLDPTTNVSGPFLIRLFAGRNLLLAGLLQSVSGRGSDDIVKGLTLLSASDAAAATIAGTRGEIPKRSAAMVVVTAALFLWLGRIVAGSTLRR